MPVNRLPCPPPTPAAVERSSSPLAGTVAAATASVPDRALPDDHRRRNWWLHVAEAGIGIGAMGLINSNTVGTALVERLGGPAWMIGLAPLLMIAGFSLGPLLNAHHLDRQHRFLPVLLRAMPWSRLSLPVIAAALWWAHTDPDRTGLALAVVMIGYLWFGVIGGLGVGAWQQVVAKTVAPAERPRLLASRYLLANLLGIAAGAAVTAILARWPGLDGYAVLHLLTLGGWAVAFVLLSRIREPAEAPAMEAADNPGLIANLRSLPGLFSADPRLRWFLISSVLVSSHFLLVGFLALHARAVVQAPESFIGVLTTAQMAGAVAGTLFAVWRGNHHGSRSLLLTARVLFLVAAIVAIAASTATAFIAVFALYGAAFWINIVGHNAMTLELMPVARRATVLAAFGAVGVPSMILAGQLGAALWHAGLPFAIIAGLSAIGLLASLLTLLPVRLDTGNGSRG